ncbi:mucin-7-like [Manihot esculenta]|uniref:mucin-7-like n=1 Tax=Manihot esculenta TaxID=3983 RepID=UPI000B5D52B2|nr:mucin-7-like [Manihot esculenta]
MHHECHASRVQTSHSDRACPVPPCTTAVPPRPTAAPPHPAAAPRPSASHSQSSHPASSSATASASAPGSASASAPVSISVDPYRSSAGSTTTVASIGVVQSQDHSYNKKEIGRGRSLLKDYTK